MSDAPAPSTSDLALAHEPAGLVLRHDGPVTQDAIVAHGRVLRALPGLSENARHRVFSAYVELAQNIARYSVVRAGLGLIDLARRASAPPSHHTEPGPDGLVLFTLVAPLPVV